MNRLIASIAALAVSLAAGAQEVQNEQKDTIRYVDASTFRIIGQAKTEGAGIALRPTAGLPEKFDTQGTVGLGKNSSGVAVRFRTDSKRITARWEVLNNMWMNHMTPTGIKGLDLYALENGKWMFVGSARPGHAKGTFTSQFITDTDGSMREYMLYLPLYDGATKVEIGVYGKARIEAPQVNSPSGKSRWWCTGRVLPRAGALPGRGCRTRLSFRGG